MYRAPTFCFWYNIFRSVGATVLLIHPSRGGAPGFYILPRWGVVFWFTLPRGATPGYYIMPRWGRIQILKNWTFLVGYWIFSILIQGYYSWLLDLATLGRWFYCSNTP